MRTQENCTKLVDSLNNSLIAAENLLTNCGCGADPCAANVLAADYNVNLHIGAIFIILVTSFLGVAIPLVGKFAKRYAIPEFGLALGKYFGVGIIIACALVHMLQPASQSLVSPCLGYAFSQDYQAYAFLFATIAIFAMHGLDVTLVSCVRQHIKQVEKMEDDEEQQQKGRESLSEQVHHDHFQHHHHVSTQEQNPIEITLEALFLEFAFTVHSIFIGLAVGVSNDTFNSLLTALVFHQLFEGVALGSRLADPYTKISMGFSFFLALIFASAAPIGIMMGVVVTSAIQPSQSVFLLAEGILDSFCAGILLYVGLSLILSDFPKTCDKLCHEGKHVSKKKFALFLSMWSGAGLMAFIGKYL